MSSDTAGVVRISERVDKIHTLDAQTRTETPRVPRSVKLELTSCCDMECYFCSSRKRGGERGDMSQAFYRRILRELRELGVEQLGLFYIGESMLCEWLPEAISYAKRDCGYPYVFLTTNGLAATEDRVRAAMEAGLDSLKFALNWSGGRQLERVANVAAIEFDQIVQNIRSARWARDDLMHETGHRCALYASTLSYDAAQPERMRKVLAEVESCVDEHYWLPLFGHTGLPADAEGGRPVPVKPLPCWPLFTEAHITWDGKLSACSLDAGSRFHMGDLNNAGFLELWHGEPFKALRAAHLAGNVKNTACRHCVAYAS